MSCKRPGPIRRAWAFLRRRAARLLGHEPRELPPLDWGDEPALVPIGPPRRPLPAGAVALEIPTEPDPLVYPTETEAVGRRLGIDFRDDPSKRLRRLLALWPFRRSSPAL